jgi:formylglycine-generating enzyme required for sulfatase activity
VPQGVDGKKKKLTRSFSLCAIPVTRRLYALFDVYHEQDFEDYKNFSPLPRCPAIHVSYWDALMVSIWLHGGLLDEWEWEYACRGGASDSGDKQPMWWWGNDETLLQEHAWIAFNSGYRTQAVGQKIANSYRLYDMLGNVFEWTSSLWSEKGNSRVVRGGSFKAASSLARCSTRGYYGPSASFHFIGCRVARADF